MDQDSPPPKLPWLTPFWIALGGYMIWKTGLRLSAGSTGFWPWAKLLVGLWLVGSELYRLVTYFRRRSASVKAAVDKPLRSLVFLLDEPRKIEPGPWIEQLGEALGVKLNEDGEKSTTFIMPMPHPAIPSERGQTFMLQIPQGVFWLFHVHQPYFTDPKEIEESIRDRRLREAVARHRAWMSADLLHWHGDEPSQEEVYSILGRIMAALAGPDVCAVLSPELERCNEFSPELIEKLRTAPLALFDEPTHDPVYNIATDDPDMQKAVAEAQRRWPEFVGYFEDRMPGEKKPFAIKTCFGPDDDHEIMWVEVTAIEENMVIGRLANQPHRIDDLHAGQEVRVPADEVVDWLCSDAAGKPLGGWTQAVLSDQPGRHLGELK